MFKVFKKNSVLKIICFALFIIPFFWFKKNEVDYGGDSTRLYFYNSLQQISNYFVYIINPTSSLGAESPAFFYIPFFLLLGLVKKVLLDSSYLLNNLVNGVLLSGSFISVYLIVKELLAEDNKNARTNYPAIFSGLFFTFSPLIIYNWERALEAINQVFIYPLVFLLFLKYLNTKRSIYLVLLTITTFVFSINFNLGASPWLFAFFPFAIIFLFFYAFINQKLRVFLKGFILSLFLFILVSFFHLFPNIIDMVNSGNVYFQLIFSKSLMENRGLDYFLSVQPHIRLTYNLTNQPAFVISKGYGHQFARVMYDSGVRQLFLFFTYPILVCVGIIFCNKEASLLQKKLINLILILFLVLLFLMTANITDAGLEIYKKLFYIPGFQMFRSFYTKFAITYIFFYSLLLGFSVELILRKIKSSWRKRLLMFFLTCLVSFNAWPLISGKIVNPILLNSNNVRAPTEMDPLYEKFIDLVKDQKPDLRVLNLPLTNEGYQILQGKNKGAYLGPSSVGYMTGKRTFAGANQFSFFWPQIETLIEKEKYSELKKIFGLLNIGYVFHNKDNYIYDNFPSNPYSDWLKKIFPNQESISEFVKKLDVKNIISVSSYNWYLLKNPLPIFYVPKKLVYAKPIPDLLSEIIGLNGDEQRIGIYSEKIISSKDNIIVNDYLISGKESEKINDEYLSFSNIDSCQNVFYPFVKKRPEILRTFVLLKEKFEEFLVRKDLSKLVDKKLFFANKRLNEAVLLNGFNEKNLNPYIKEIAGAVLILKKNDKKPVRRPDLVYRIIHNLKGNLTKIDNSDLSNPSEWKNTVNKLLIEASEAVETYSIGTKEFYFDIPAPGEYSFLLKGKSDLETQNMFKGIGSYSVNLGNGQRVNSEDMQLIDKDGWIYYGKTFLDSGEKKIAIDLNAKSEVLHKGVLNWQEDTWYRLQGIGKSGSKIKLTTGDNQAMFREFCTDSDGGKFDFFVKSPIKAVPVKIAGEIDNINIFPVSSLNLLIKSTDNENKKTPDGITPKITFLKINPTKYRIKIENAVSFYTLVFSESFHPDWKLYLSQSSISEKYDNYFNKMIASYFNGEITEGSHLNIFLNKDTFETWAKKPIALDRHYLINGYANAWNITPQDVQGKTDYELIVEYAPQNIFLVCSLVSLITFFGCLLFLTKNSVKMLRKSREK